MPVVIVTGASSGIGRTTAERLARNGTTVVLAARRADKLQALAAHLPNAVPIPTDVRDPAAIDALVAQALALTGRVDGLVNNAGIGGVASILVAGAFPALADRVYANRAAGKTDVKGQL